MPRYSCRVATTRGEVQNIAIDAPDSGSAATELSSKGYVILEVEEQQTSRRGGTLFGRVSGRELFIFSKQLYVLIRAGIPMVSALEILGSDHPNRKFRSVVGNMAQSVESGESLSESMMRHPDVFSPIFIHTVKAGEKGSRLEEVLSRLIGYQEGDLRMRSKIIGSLIYPSVLLSVSTLIMIFLVGHVVPSFAKVFKDLDAPLPFMTRQLLEIGNALNASLPFMAVVLVALMVVYRFFGNISVVRGIIDRLKVRLPFFGGMAERVSVLRFCQVLELLIESGVPLVDAIKTVAEAVENREYGRRFSQVASHVAVGNSLADALREVKVGREMVIRLVNVGERSSDLPSMLRNIGELYEDELRNRIELMLSLLEPALLIVMGVMACFIILSLFLPIFQMATVVR